MGDRTQQRQGLIVGVQHLRISPNLRAPCKNSAGPVTRGRPARSVGCDALSPAVQAGARWHIVERTRQSRFYAAVSGKPQRSQCGGHIYA